MPTVASIIFDLVMVGIVVLAVFLGKKTGLLRMAFVLGIVFIAVFLGRLFLPIISAGIEKTHVGDKIKTSVNDRIMEWVEDDNTLNFDGAMEKLGLPKSLREKASQSIEDVTEAKGAELAEKISGFVSKTAVKVLTYVVLVVLVIIALVIISLLTKLIEKIPVLGDINATGGAIVGAVIGLLVVFVICLLFFGWGIGKSEGIIAQIAQKSFLIRAINWLGVTGRIAK